MALEPRVVLEGLIFPEVLRWRGKELWFSDMQWWLPDASGQVVVVDEDGTARTVVDRVPKGPSTGLGWLPDGRLMLTAAEGRSLLVLEPDGTLAAHADLSGVTAYPLNDMVVDASGRAYVGSCDAAGTPTPSPSELIVVHPDGRAEVADTEMRFPNGMVITPDGGALIVAESYGQCLTAFNIASDGTLGDKREWATVPGTAPDGICLDREGCIWFADAAGNACVRVAEGGEVRDRVETEKGAYACTLGGDDVLTLFVATSTFPASDTDPARPGEILAYEVDVPGTGSP